MRALVCTLFSAHSVAYCTVEPNVSPDLTAGAVETGDGPELVATKTFGLTVRNCNKDIEAKRQRFAPCPHGYKFSATLSKETVFSLNIYKKLDGDATKKFSNFRPNCLCYDYNINLWTKIAISCWFFRDAIFQLLSCITIKPIRLLLHAMSIAVLDINNDV